MSPTVDPAELVLAIAASTAAGLIGCFAVMRRMALAADAMSHIALPGIGIAIAIGVHPVGGALAMLVVGALLIWGLERRTGIPTDTLIGVVFSTSLAIGALTSSGEELIDALFGGAGRLTTLELGLGVVVAAAITWFVLARRSQLVLRMVSPEVARTSGIDVARLDLCYLVAFAFTVALGLRYLGVLLVGSMIIIPAATAKRLARSLDQMLGLAVVTAVVATTAGIGIAVLVDRPSGPVVICLAAAQFVASLAVRRR